MNYQAFSNDALLMMHHGTRGALAVDDELTKLGEEHRFQVRETSDWKKHADDLEAEMSRRGMIFDVIDWSAVQKVDCVLDIGARQPEVPQPDCGSPPSDFASLGDKAQDPNARLMRRIAAVIKMR